MRSSRKCDLFVTFFLFFALTIFLFWKNWNLFSKQKNIFKTLRFVYLLLRHHRLRLNLLLPLGQPHLPRLLRGPLPLRHPLPPHRRHSLLRWRRPCHYCRSPSFASWLPQPHPAAEKKRNQQQLLTASVSVPLRSSRLSPTPKTHMLLFREPTSIATLT